MACDVAMRADLRWPSPEQRVEYRGVVHGEVHNYPSAGCVAQSPPAEVGREGAGVVDACGQQVPDPSFRDQLSRVTCNGLPTR